MVLVVFSEELHSSMQAGIHLHEKARPRCRQCQLQIRILTKSLAFTSMASVLSPKKENSDCLVSLITLGYQGTDWELVCLGTGQIGATSAVSV